MTVSFSTSSDPSRHRRYKPGAAAAASFSAVVSPPPEPVAESVADPGTGWRVALSTLEQNHHDRLTQLEERLAAAERLASDLAGQIREMR